MALWCSRLARQPVTLEVDGSSPFGVAIKRKTTHRVVFSFYKGFGRTRIVKCNSPVDCCLAPAGRGQHCYCRPFSDGNANESVRGLFVQRAEDGLESRLFKFQFIEQFTWLPLWGSCQRARYELLTERANFSPLRPKSWIWGTSPIGRGKSLHSFKLLYKLQFAQLMKKHPGLNPGCFL